jgi:predicted  nucleic acid-binding Zn-ribbon protein
VPTQLEKTRTRLEREKDSAVRRDLENQIRQLEQQKASLEATVNSVRAGVLKHAFLAGHIYARCRCWARKSGQR